MFLYYSSNFSEYWKISLINFWKNKIKKITVWHKIHWRSESCFWHLVATWQQWCQEMVLGEGMGTGGDLILCRSSMELPPVPPRSIRAACFSANLLNTTFCLRRPTHQKLCDPDEVLNLSMDLVSSRSEGWRGKRSLGWLPEFWLEWHLRKRRRRHSWGVGRYFRPKDSKNDLLCRSSVETQSHLILTTWDFCLYPKLMERNEAIMSVLSNVL